MFAAVTLLLALGCGSKSGAGKDAKAPVGKVSAVSGEVTVRRGDAPGVPAVVGLPVSRDMVFVTGADGALEIRFDNNYTWKLAAGRERAIAKLRVVDLARVDSQRSVDDQLAGEDTDRTAAAGRHAEQSAAEGASTVERRSSAVAPPAAAVAPEPAAAAPEKPMAPEVPVVVESAPEEKEAKEAPTPPPAPPAKATGNALRKSAPKGDAMLGLDVDAAPGGGGGEVKDDHARPAQPLMAMRPKILACARKHQATGKLVVRVTVDTEGKVAGVMVEGELAGTPMAGCAAETLSAARFAKQAARTEIRFTYDLPAR